MFDEKGPTRGYRIDPAPLELFRLSLGFQSRSRGDNVDGRADVSNATRPGCGVSDRRNRLAE
jgi:hypothetical protein